MANAKQCDRCKEFYNIPIELIHYNEKISYNGIGLIDYTNRGSRGNPIDMCPNCLNDINTFITNPDSAIVVPEQPDEPEIELPEE